jgi:hypothetical protein
MMLMYWNESEAPITTPEEREALAQAWAKLRKELAAAGVLVSSNGVAPNTTTTTVRVRAGKTMITDGPFAETHEQLGGYFLLNCKDLDEAIRWAEKIPSAEFGSIEIRPLWGQNIP